MHIHGSPPINQFASLSSTQATQQATAARRAAATVRNKVSSFAASDGEDTSYRVEARGEADPNRRRPSQSRDDEEAFRSIFVSVSA